MHLLSLERALESELSKIFDRAYKMPNAWISHLKAYRAKHKGMSLGEAMKAAKSTYKKSSKADDAKPKKKARKKRRKK